MGITNQFIPLIAPNQKCRRHTIIIEPKNFHILLPTFPHVLCACESGGVRFSIIGRGAKFTLRIMHKRRDRLSFPLSTHAHLTCLSIVFTWFLYRLMCARFHRIFMSIHLANRLRIRSKYTFPVRLSPKQSIASTGSLPFHHFQFILRHSLRCEFYTPCKMQQNPQKNNKNHRELEKRQTGESTR